MATTQEKSQIDLDALTVNIVENLENILNLLGVDEYSVYPNRIAFPCPIHNGDNDEGCSIFTEGRETLGNWVCWTHACHRNDYEINGKREYLGSNLLGFIRGVLGEGGNPVTYSQAISWVLKALKCDVDKIEKSKNRDFVKLSRKFSKVEHVVTGTIGRSEVRKQLEIPASYYLDRGYSSEILDKYDIGLCRTKGKQMYLRVVCPVYDENFKLLGCCGRSTQPKCKKCGDYHFENRQCPANKIEKMWAAKWRNSRGEFAAYTFYNLWYAMQHIHKTGTVILTEGCGDIWKLEEAGIHVGLGMFKPITTDSQDDILKKMPISNMIIATDNDSAGKDGTEKLKEKFGRYYNIYEPKLPKNDIGDMSIQEIQDVFNPILSKIGKI